MVRAQETKNSNTILFRSKVDRALFHSSSACAHRRELKEGWLGPIGALFRRTSSSWRTLAHEHPAGKETRQVSLKRQFSLSGRKNVELSSFTPTFSFPLQRPCSLDRSMPMNRRLTEAHGEAIPNQMPRYLSPHVLCMSPHEYTFKLLFVLGDTCPSSTTATICEFIDITKQLPQSPGHDSSAYKKSGVNKCRYSFMYVPPP